MFQTAIIGVNGWASIYLPQLERLEKEGKLRFAAAVVRNYSGRKLELPPLSFRQGGGFDLMLNYAEENRGPVFGYRSTAHNIGCMIASCCAGWVVYSCGNARAAFYCGALLVLLLIPVTVWIVKRAMRQPFYIAHSPFGKQG